MYFIFHSPPKILTIFLVAKDLRLFYLFLGCNCNLFITVARKLYFYRLEMSLIAYTKKGYTFNMFMVFSLEINFSPSY
jgi:hypothetical protein